MKPLTAEQIARDNASKVAHAAARAHVIAFCERETHALIAFEIVMRSKAHLHLKGVINSGYEEDAVYQIVRELHVEGVLGHVGFNCGAWAFRPTSDAAWADKFTGWIEGRPETHR